MGEKRDGILQQSLLRPVPFRPSAADRPIPRESVSVPPRSPWAPACWGSNPAGSIPAGWAEPARPPVALPPRASRRRSAGTAPRNLRGQVDIVWLDPTDLRSTFPQPLLGGSKPIPGELGKLETDEGPDGFHGRGHAGGDPGWFQSRTTNGGGPGDSSRQVPRLNATDSVKSSTNGPV